jgi:hypothetical protein
LFGRPSGYTNSDGEFPHFSTALLRLKEKKRFIIPGGGGLCIRFDQKARRAGVDDSSPETVSFVKKDHRFVDVASR